MFSPRWMIGLAVTAFWLVMMGFLYAREGIFSRRTAAPPGAETIAEPVDTWMGVYLDNARIGHLHFRQTRETRHDLDGAAMRVAARMRLPLLGESTELDLNGSVWRPLERPAAGAPGAEFEFAIASAGYDFRVDGELRGGELRAEVRSAGESFPLRWPVDNEVLFAGGLGSPLSLPPIEVGETYRLASFDPLTLGTGTARVRCLARETLELSMGPVDARRLEIETGGLRTLAWVDESGAVVRAETPLGLVLERMAPEEAATPPVGGSLELLERTAVRPTGERPFRGAREMTIAVRGVGESGLPESGLQAASGNGRYRLRAPAEPEAERVQVSPPDGLLAADAFVQVDHPRIRRQAEEIVGDAEKPWHRAQAIHRWVYANVEKAPALSVPSALEVLERRRGDCNEHTVLFTALARAAGLPTRIAIGLVWSDELEGFYYHAWPEVFVDGRFVAMDPTLGQPLADATHVKLLDGGIERWPRLLAYLGQLEIEVLDVR